jgi:predicted NAD-dependent protein-ADP-ribosyltransferase YbiA (DUF1768 family)
MLGILRSKFQLPEMRNVLVQTQGRHLVLASYDRYWGIGLSINNALRCHQRGWTGSNVLGLD